MAVVSNHLSTRLRLTDADKTTVQSFGQIRSSINGNQAISLMEAVNRISSRSVVGALMTVTTELTEM